MECVFTMPPMDQATFGPWQNFLFACNGMASVFQLPIAIFQVPSIPGQNFSVADLLPFGFNSPNPFEYWQLKSNSTKWSINVGLVYGLTFTIRTALPTQWQANGTAGTFQGWPVITSLFPASLAPQSLEITTTSLVGSTESPFSGEILINPWSNTVPVIEAACTLPPLGYTDAQPWISFLIAASGPQCVFQLPVTFAQQNGLGGAGLVPINETPSGYFRMKANTVKWTINPGLIYNISFDLRSAL